MDSLLVFASLVVLSKAVPECESPEWTFYERDKCCIVVIEQELIYSEAKQLCQSLGGDLPIIMDSSKLDFVLKNIVDEADDEASYWIGLTNRDGDGVFEWANGSRLDINIVSDETRYGFDPAYRASDCGMVIGSQYDLWSCWSQYRPICERCPQPSTTTAADETQCAYPDLECNCNKGTWIHYKQGHKYLKVFNVLKDYDSAVSHCDSFGAQLLNLPDNATVNFVLEQSKSWTERFMFYWVGVSRESGSLWMWSNGTEFEETGYLRWLADSISHLRCSGIVWQLFTNLISTECGSKNYFICEAEDPCAIEVILHVGDVELNGGHYVEGVPEIPVTNDQQMAVRCFTREFQSIIEEVVITCTDQNVTVAVGVQEAFAVVFMNVSMHGVTCTCIMDSKVKDSRQLKIDFMIFFYTRPLLVREPDEMEKTVTRLGETLKVEVDIYANPRPQASNLTMNESAVDPEGYRVKMTITPSKHIIRYTAVLSIFGFNPNKSGFYTLTITNGIETDLEYTFFAEYQEEKAAEPELFEYWLVIVGIAVFIALAIASRCIGRSILVIDEDDYDDEMECVDYCNYGPEEACDEPVESEKDDVIEPDDDPKEDQRQSVKGFYDAGKRPSDAFGSNVDPAVGRKVTWMSGD